LWIGREGSGHWTGREGSGQVGMGRLVRKGKSREWKGWERGGWE